MRAAWTPIRRLLLAALLVAALAPAASAAAVKPAPVTKGAWTRTLPQYFQGNSVAVGPGGARVRPLHGERIRAFDRPVTAAGKAAIEEVRKEEDASAVTGSVTFDPQGDLWFVIDRAEREGRSIARLGPGGGLAEFKLPEDEAVTALTIGPEGDAWFTRVGEGEMPAAQIGRMTPTGELTEFPLEAGSRPPRSPRAPTGRSGSPRKRRGGSGGSPAAVKYGCSSSTPRSSCDGSSPAPTAPSGSPRTPRRDATAGSATGSAGSRPKAR